MNTITSEITMLIILAGQLASSLLSTMTIHAVTGNSPLKAVSIAAISDTLKLAM